MQRHIEHLKATLMNEGAYRAALEAFKADKPGRDGLMAAYEAVTGLPARSGATKTELWRGLERHGASERRAEARAEVSRRIMPI